MDWAFVPELNTCWKPKILWFNSIIQLVMCDLFNPCSYVEVILKHISILKLQAALLKAFFSHLAGSNHSSVSSSGKHAGWVSKHIKRNFSHFMYFFLKVLSFFSINKLLIHYVLQSFRNKFSIPFCHANRKVMYRQCAKKLLIFWFYRLVPIFRHHSN